MQKVASVKPSTKLASKPMPSPYRRPGPRETGPEPITRPSSNHCPSEPRTSTIHFRYQLECGYRSQHLLPRNTCHALHVYLELVIGIKYLSFTRVSFRWSSALPIACTRWTSAAPAVYSVPRRHWQADSCRQTATNYCSCNIKMRSTGRILQIMPHFHGPGLAKARRSVRLTSTPDRIWPLRIWCLEHCPA